MARINLLPWRADRRKQRERDFYKLLGATAMMAIAVVFIAYLWMDEIITNQQSRNLYLQDQIKLLDAKIEKIKELEKTKTKLLQRKQIIEQLQASRSQMVHLFDELVHTIPDGARLSGLKQNGDTLTLDGVAQSNANVASYMRNLDESKWLGHSDLRKTEAKHDDKKSPYVFSMDVKVRKPESEENAGEAAPAAGGPAKPADKGATPSPVAAQQGAKS